MKLLLVLVLCCCCSCAAILGGGNLVTVNCQSDPAGAKVYSNGSLMGTTPTSIQVDKRKDQTLQFRKDGYDEKTQMVGSSAKAGWIVCDVLLGGLIGVVVDAATGDWNGLDREMVSVILEKK